MSYTINSSSEMPMSWSEAIDFYHAEKAEYLNESANTNTTGTPQKTQDKGLEYDHNAGGYGRRVLANWLPSLDAKALADLTEGKITASVKEECVDCFTKKSLEEFAGGAIRQRLQEIRDLSPNSPNNERTDAVVTTVALAQTYRTLTGEELSQEQRNAVREELLSRSMAVR